MNTIFGEAAVTLREAIQVSLKSAGAVNTNIRLQLPHNPIFDVDVLSIPQGDQYVPPVHGIIQPQCLWAHFPDPPGLNPHALTCRFGSTISDDQHPVRGSVQILLPTDQQGLNRRGRILREGDTLFLGHRGGLGGGGAGVVPIATFVRIMNSWGWTTESVLTVCQRQQEVFVIGNPKTPSFVDRLFSYVNCCFVMRQIAQAGHLNQY